MPNRSRKSDQQRFTDDGNTIGIYIYVLFQFTQQRKREQKKEECMLNKMHNARK